MLEDLLAILHPPRMIHERVMQRSTGRTILSIQFSVLEHSLSRQASIGIDGEVLEKFLGRLGPRGIHEVDEDDTPQADEKSLERRQLGTGGNKLEGHWHVQSTDVAVHSQDECSDIRVAPQNKQPSTKIASYDQTALERSSPPSASWATVLHRQDAVIMMKPSTLGISLPKAFTLTHKTGIMP